MIVAVMQQIVTSTRRVPGSNVLDGFNLLLAGVSERQPAVMRVDLDGRAHS
jgi:hypothetical protein